MLLITKFCGGCVLIDFFKDKLQGFLCFFLLGVFIVVPLYGVSKQTVTELNCLGANLVSKNFEGISSSTVSFLFI